jgi:hypothetical protein
MSWTVGSSFPLSLYWNRNLLLAPRLVQRDGLTVVTLGVPCGRPRSYSPGRLEYNEAQRHYKVTTLLTGSVVNMLLDRVI